ncbi:U-box domain-containing protein 52-like isoform X1 [Daucus carota subsp. sativus]|uniref:U-box domain-containing protein 52-like isoform X1 n=2 Tax=Daucus carota subsp. sativus TaxID=79200 RepID=UPI003083C981
MAAATKNKLVAVAIGKDKGSQVAMKWAVDSVLNRGQTVFLLHVKLKVQGPPSVSLFPPRSNRISEETGDADPQSIKELFLPFRCFCTRKDIHCQDIVIEDTDIAKGLVNYVAESAIEVLVLGAGSKGGLFRRFKLKDIPGSVLKGLPDFCTVYVISKGKISITRSSSRSAPPYSPLRNQLLYQASSKTDAEISSPNAFASKGVQRPPFDQSSQISQTDSSFKSPLPQRNDLNGISYGDLSQFNIDISFVSSGRPSAEYMFPAFSDSFDMSSTPTRLSNISDADSQGYDFGRTSVDTVTATDISYASSDGSSSASQPVEDVEAEMRRLKIELKQTMDMYSTACKEALSAKQKAMELQRWKLEEERKLEEARIAEESVMAAVEKEKAKYRAAIEHAEAAQRLAEIEAQKRRSAELKALKEAEEKNQVLDTLGKSDVRYRKYSIEEIEAATEFFSQKRKVGEGGYGPVFKCYLDHTPVAVKVLRPDAAQGKSQFQQEVEILSCIRHPNMVLLLGACPEYGCLVYEYMSNGSLEDRLSLKGNSKPLSWQHRFRIAAEIGAALLFLHQTKPEPLVHRDLKPANILLDRNFVSKISDVGLARIVPPSVADAVTQYHMTSTAGTFCYIDPEYQQTGMLGVKSDVYSLGIMFLQIITAKPPMGLTHHVERAIEEGKFHEILDQAVPDWPVEEALGFAKMSLKCAELRRKDRPDLGSVVMPELERLRELAEDQMPESVFYSDGPSPSNSQDSVSQG